jgi:hypothetical protein
MMSYARKAIDKIRELPRQSGALLWVFPECDYFVYKAMPDTPVLNSYGDYLALIAVLQANLERSGKSARRVRIPVVTMLAELEKQG